MSTVDKPVDYKKNWKYCNECKDLHPELARCECGACLCKNSKQIPDDDYPLFKCTKCGRVHFWD